MVAAFDSDEKWEWVWEMTAPPTKTLVLGLEECILIDVVAYACYRGNDFMLEEN